MNTFTIKVKEENGDIYLYEDVKLIQMDDIMCQFTRVDGRQSTHLMDYVDELSITKNL